MLTTPILFLIFNREDTTRRVFEAIRQQKPKRLYVAADGPRKDKEGEIEKCRKVRSIIDQIDWDCELKTLFRDENLGCQKAISSAITWFFEQEEQGIILEDDCLPHPSFFPYCEELLEKYKDDTRIGHITGTNFFPKLVKKEISYDFSGLVNVWGWASWRRAWKNFDLDLHYWKENRNIPDEINNLYLNKREKIYFSSFISDALYHKNGINSWATLYIFSLRIQNQLSICPSVNLVTNIGLNSDQATHTKKNNNKLSFPRSSIKFPLKHPEYFIRNTKLDETMIKTFYFSWKRLLRYLLKDY